ncbi:MAG: type I 3-dehydroquinate dehydratase [Candidatus Lokiarchaeota archaeon]|nr:type I 3-dehydroquinate dehydratase [Candidatus Lokiarchaeota archaeon]
MKMNICVAIQIKSAEIEYNSKIIKEALDNHADLIELRFDYIDNIEGITKNFVNNLISLIHPKAQIICTFRDHNEGGQKKMDNNLRLRLLKLLIETQPDYLDIEMATQNTILFEVIKLAAKKNVNLIFSHHDFTKTPILSKSLAIIDTFRDKIQKETYLENDIIKKNILKLIFTANSFEDNLVPFQLLNKITAEGQKIITFCMGESGMLSRFFCLNLGSFLTYASIDDGTAPGQIHIKKLKHLYSLLFP